MDQNMCLHMRIRMVIGCLLGMSHGSEFWFTPSLLASFTHLLFFLVKTNFFDDLDIIKNC